MTTIITADLLAAGVRFRSEEAVAIAQQLIHGVEPPGGTPPMTAPLGPPSPDNVHLYADGSVTCVGCYVKPAVFEIAILLQTLLPAGAFQVPGGLRYAIARGVLDVDAPPYDSIEEFSRGLERFERGDRRAVVRALLSRVAGQPAPHSFGHLRRVPPAVDRRRTAPSTAVLRRELQAADRRLYEQGRAAVPPLVLRASPPADVRPDAVDSPLILSPSTAEHFAQDNPVDRGSTAQPASLVGTKIPGRLAAAAVLMLAAALAGMFTANRLHDGTPRPPAATRMDTAAPVATAAPSTPSNPATEMSVAPAVAKPPRGVTNTRVNAPAARAIAVASEGAVVQLDAEHHPVFSPAFASNGSAVFFHTGSTRDARSSIAMVSAPDAGGDLGVMSIVDDGARNFHVQPSPDGRSIAFDSDRDGERGVYLANRDGSRVRRISGAGYAAVPTWAPDGRRLTYVRAEPNNPKVWNLWMQSLESGEVQRLTNYRYGQPWSASWFPDNRRIAYTHEDKLIVLDLEAKRSQTFDSPVKGRLVRTPAVAPDGTMIAFQVFRQGAWLLNLTDGSMRCILTDPTAEEFAWAPDGRRLAFHSRRDGQWGIYILHRG
jgi:Tol biopolymer transport system component